MSAFVKSILFSLAICAAACSSGTSQDDGEDLEPGPDAGSTQRADAAPPVDDSCGPANCNGCCDGKICLGGNANNTCGAGGDACFDCGSHSVCVQGFGSCDIDPNSKWNIMAVDAKVPEKKANGKDTWDVGGGLPDLFAKAELNGTELGETSVVKDTLTPAWDNEVIVTSVRAEDVAKVSIELIDKDLASDDPVGKCKIPAPSYETYKAGSSYSFHCLDHHTYEMNIRFQPE